MVEKWSYKIFKYMGSITKGSMMDEDLERLNRLGEQGWEAVAMTSSSNAIGLEVRSSILLKRPFAILEAEREALEAERAAKEKARRERDPAGYRLKELMKERESKSEQEGGE